MKNWRLEQGYALSFPFETWEEFFDVCREYAEARHIGGAITDSLREKVFAAGWRCRHMPPIEGDELTALTRERFTAGTICGLPWSTILDNQIIKAAIERFTP